VRYFSKKLGRKYEELDISSSSMRTMQSYFWPGNVRELKHLVEAAVITSNGKKLYFDLPTSTDTGTSQWKSFEEMEREYFLKVLNEVDWKVSGKDGASSILKMPESTLRSRLKKLGIKRP